MTDLITTAGALITSEPTATVLQVLGSAGGVVLKEGGKIALGVLIKRPIENMIEKFRKAQSDGEIPPDFEQTPHGAALLQDALNALGAGLDEERAEAVKKVFLGLARNKAGDSLERVQQLECMRMASELTAWEVVLFNALERYSKEVFDPKLGEKWAAPTTNPQQRDRIRQSAAEKGPRLDSWLLHEFCGENKAFLYCLRAAFESLHQKKVVRHNASHSNGVTEDCILTRKGVFTDYGWKLAELLYSATDYH